jgi:hypothetical protein
MAARGGALRDVRNGSECGERVRWDPGDAMVFLLEGASNI